jgi:type III secretion system HrpB2-like protein
MTAPIAPIAHVDELLRTAATQPATTPKVSPELAQKFDALMTRSEQAGTAPGGPNVVTDILARQQDGLQGVQNEVAGLMQAAPNMSAVELNAATMVVSRDVATNNFKLQAATSITSGSNKSLQTLLKNQ